ncbi:C-type lectin domain family 7 member A-like [Cavia porcellus]|uniref:C-type lectin domain family 7 member A-like n=1 Tax=Cavia porcellus TaxID=10141 RepID=UPI002FDF1D76
MDEEYPTFAQVGKPLTSKKRMQKNKKKQQEIYSEVEEYPLYMNQTKIKTESPKEKESSVPIAWRLTVMILASLCFFLFLTNGVLGFMVFQGFPTDQSPKCPLENTTQEDESHVQSLPFTLEPISTGENIEYKDKWSCCGQSCYYFSTKVKNFEDSRKFCKEMDSTLLKIEDPQELNFIQSQVFYFTWIGLSREGISRHWTWEDKSTPFLTSAWKDSEIGNCGSLTPTKVTALDCSKLTHCICEKKNVCLSTMRLPRPQQNEHNNFSL